MARERSPKRDKAYQLWIESGKTRALKDIAAELDVSDVQIRKWKNQDNWEGNGKVTLPKKKKSNVTKEKRQRGGQPGNGNAKGHGPPKGTQNNLKHGLYEQVYWDSVTDDELAMISDMDMSSAEGLLMQTISLLTIRERRLMKRIKEQEEAKGGLAVLGVEKRVMDVLSGHHPGQTGTFIKETESETSTKTVSTIAIIEKLEAELTKVQKQKAKCTVDLFNMRKADKGNGNSTADDWIAAVLGEPVGGADDG